MDPRAEDRDDRDPRHVVREDVEREIPGSGEAELDLDGRPVRLRNLDKVFYPRTGFTKGQVLDYYLRISPVLLPHLRGRPLTMKRYPDGVEGQHFYEKRCPDHRPGWISTVEVPSERHGTIEYCVLDDLPSLMWAVNLADLEMHTSLHRAPPPQRPDFVAFDLDPGAPAALLECCEVALLIRGMLSELGHESRPKTSGSKGIQVYVPVAAGTGYDRTKAFARSVAEVLERRLPDRIVSSMSRSARKGRVLVDWSQNDAHKTTVTAYSLRATPEPSVSTPLGWEELEEAAGERDASGLAFGPDDVLRRVARRGDLFAPVLGGGQHLPER